MITAACLTWLCISGVRRGASRAKRPANVFLFASLSASSLATTWYHMFRFFAWSYHQWELSSPLSLTHDELYLGLWLRDTSLFKQAWVSTLETPPRAWWSMQIFGFCALFSVMLAVQKDRRRLPYPWAFMLLGQLVAISFASNLFFLTVLYRDAAPTPRTELTRAGGNSRKRWFSLQTAYHALIVLQISIAIAIPRSAHTTGFLRLLLLPHILAFAPLLLHAVWSFGKSSPQSRGPPLSSYISALSLVALLCAATAPLLGKGASMQSVIATLNEHPAVSSVGWDVICCWVSYTTWAICGGELL